MGMITATVSNASAQSVAALIAADAGHLNHTGHAVNWLTVRGDDGNAGNFLFLGEADVSSSDYGAKLATGDSRTWTTPGGAGANAVSLQDKWLLASAGATKVNISWETA